MSKGSERRPSAVSGDHYRNEHDRIFSIYTCEICGGNEVNAASECVRCGPLIAMGHMPGEFGLLDCACDQCQRVRDCY